MYTLEGEMGFWEVNELQETILLCVGFYILYEYKFYFYIVVLMILKTEIFIEVLKGSSLLKGRVF